MCGNREVLISAPRTDFHFGFKSTVSPPGSRTIICPFVYTRLHHAKLVLIGSRAPPSSDPDYPCPASRPEIPAGFLRLNLPEVPHVVAIWHATKVAQRASLLFMAGHAPGAFIFYAAYLERCLLHLFHHGVLRPIHRIASYYAHYGCQ